MSHPTSRLVSLWEMLKHDAEHFYRVTTALVRLEETLRQAVPPPAMGAPEIAAMEREQMDLIGAVYETTVQKLGDELEVLGCALTLKEVKRLANC